MYTMSMSTMSISTMSVSSPDDKLSENIWFVWSKTSNDGDKWRCHHGDKRTNNKVKTELVNKLTKDCWLSQWKPFPFICSVKSYPPQDLSQSYALLYAKKKSLLPLCVIVFRQQYNFHPANPLPTANSLRQPSQTFQFAQKPSFKQFDAIYQSYELRKLVFAVLHSAARQLDLLHLIQWLGE